MISYFEFELTLSVQLTRSAFSMTSLHNTDKNASVDFDIYVTFLLISKDHKEVISECTKSFLTVGHKMDYSNIASIIK